MKTENNEFKWSLLAGFVFIALAVLGIGFLFSIVNAFTKLPQSSQVVIGTAVLTVVGSVSSLIYTTNKNRQREIEQALYEKKQPVYEKLLTFLFDLMNKSRKNEALDEEQMIEFIINFSKDLMLWGSDNVIKEYINWRRVAAADPKPAEMFLSLENVIRAIRLNFGHTNKGIEKGDLLSLILTDIDKMLKDENSNE